MENRKAYVITGPTSGIGYETALALARHGTVVLVGRNREKLRQVEQTIKDNGQNAVSVLCDISDIISVRRAARQIIDLHLPIAGVLNNAGIMLTKATDKKSAQGFDLTFATNHLGAFALTEALVPHLADSTNIAFIVSAIEDPERKPAKAMGMKGGRYISAEASATGKWKEGGSNMAGIDAYATSKQALLASVLAFARATPRLRFNAIEPGITRGTNLGGANAMVRFLFGHLMALLPPFRKYSSTPKKSARVITKILTDVSGKSGVYFDEKGQTMQGSALAHDPQFQDRVVAETRALLAKV